MTKKDWRVAARKTLEKSVQDAGGPARVCEFVGVTIQAVSHIMRTGAITPPRWVIPLERALAQPGLRHKLRPDLYPVEDALV